ncbi:AI-2E family transporter [Paeniglutamicibacter kerguelensis]|uniref:PurR-regulated permease PerM n=2 Tax=Paeniglutamicibacter kerguelensis TaxID=254788 RepID=A0ABS4XK90_9MICC|nr:AI-2E family transporter [Paeniglutamicibacter kerguelensis]MBP2388104.1 putative PurR-regulated permease PerM [Paeniglutamicibacter kerguelensis]
MILLALAAATVAAIGMSSIRHILAPVILTLILTICAHPVRVAMEKRGVPHGLATGSVILVVFLLLAGFIFALIIAFAQFVTMLPQFAGQLAQLGTVVTEWLGSIGIGTEQTQAIIKGIDPGKLVALATGLFGSVFSITGSLVIILTMLILMAADAVYVPTILRQLAVTQKDLVVALTSYASNVRRYMVVTTVLGVVQGVLNTLVLFVLHVPAAILWGLLAFLCSFIPNVGYFLAIIPPMVFGFFVGGWSTMIAVVIAYGLINGVVQSIIQPRVVGNAVALSQSLTFFSVLFWAVVFGPIGAILAIPLTLIFRAVLVDSDPKVRLWRPAIGDVTETRRLLMEDDAVAKEARRTRRGERRGDEESP